MAYELGQLCEIAFGERFALAVLEFEVGKVPVGLQMSASKTIIDA